MSDFAIVNFKEIEDSATDLEGMEARFARKHLDSEHLGVTFMRYDANVRSPKAHSHREQEEAYVVVSGSGRIRLDDAVHDLRQWDPWPGSIAATRRDSYDRRPLLAVYCRSDATDQVQDVGEVGVVECVLGHPGADSA